MLSAHAAAGTTHKKSIRLLATMQGKQVLILVDSGSTGSFISKAAVEQLVLRVKQIPQVTVTVADGGKTTCNTAVEDAKWLCQGHEFQTTLRVFNIPGYDMILGMDWLDEIGKMWIDWHKKKMRFRHNGERITLKGIRDNVSQCKTISQTELDKAINEGGIAQLLQLCPTLVENSSIDIPDVVVKVLDEYAECFQEPKGLPPHRAFDHHIKLLPGVQSVNVKPYHYTPQQKDEIEKQVREMLKNGIIKPSRSPFVSPVLLVKKKDGT